LLNNGLLAKNIQLSGFSLIDFKVENNWEFPACDWIFFTSKNAVKFFFEKNKVLGHQKIACVGDGTFKVLSKYVHRVDYVGNAVDTHLIGKEFAEIIGNAICFFPISNISKRTIQQYLPQNQVIEAVVYQTLITQQTTIPTTDIVVLTSPSNTINYQQIKGFQSNQILIAMGPSTAQQIKDLNLNNIIIQPTKPGEIGILDCLNNL
jgi:uroporphyrinogen-III synthase